MPWSTVRKSLSLIVVSLAAVASPVALAQQALQLREAVAAALLRAPATTAAQASVRAADASIDVAGLRRNPVLSIEAENVNGTGPFAGTRMAETTAMVEVPLEIGGKRPARVRVARAERAVALAAGSVAAADVVAATTEAFIGIVEAERRQVLARERLELAQKALRAARIRVQAGKASPLEEQRAQVEASNAQVDAEATAQRALAARLQLGRLTGLEARAVSASWFDTTGLLDEARASATPALAIADAEVAAAQARTDLAQRSRVPDITVGAGVRRFEETDDTAAVVGVSVPLPIFNSGAAEVRRARAEADRAEAERAATRLRIEGEVAAARLDVELARAAAAAAGGPALAAAREAARIARIGYAEGKFSQLDLIEAERALNLTRVSAIDALAAFHRARARLAQLQGQLTPIHLD
ncbi:MAG: TolC family protein [Gammaproteobacteria bacterium]|nr:TolC family protein [Gammaproteobacteria bacterium]